MCIRDSIHDEKTDARAYFGLAETRRVQQRFDVALDAIKKGIRLNLGDAPLPEPIGGELSIAKGPEGHARVERALAQLELDSMTARAADAYASPLDFARAHSRLGNKEKAFKYLDDALKEPSPGVVFLNVDRAWNNLRDESRFKAAVQRVGLQ